VGPEFEKGDGRLRPSSNIASPAQRGPRRDAQPLHATPLAAVLFPAPLRAHTLFSPSALLFADDSFCNVARWWLSGCSWLPWLRRHRRPEEAASLLRYQGDAQG